MLVATIGKGFWKRMVINSPLPEDTNSFVSLTSVGDPDLETSLVGRAVIFDVGLLSDTLSFVVPVYISSGPKRSAFVPAEPYISAGPA